MFNLRTAVTDGVALAALAYYEKNPFSCESADADCTPDLIRPTLLAHRQLHLKTFEISPQNL
jgi:hypothetical protein